MKKIITFTEYLNEDIGAAAGGGVGYAGLSGNGAGSVMAPTVGAVPGSVSQAGSGAKGSGDVAAYYGKNFNLRINKDKDKKAKGKKNKKEKPRYFTKRIEQNPTL